jgi:excisionase family DNA binding protein
VCNLERLLYSRETAAQALSVSVRTIEYALARGEFETRMVGRRRLITARSLKRWASCNHYGPVKGPKQDKGKSKQDKGDENQSLAA